MTFYRRRHREMIYATGFAIFLLVFTVGLLGFSLLTAGPLVLGTELNTNGMVEYLCLGRGCDHLQDMDF